MTSGYSATITQGSNTVLLGTAGANLTGGNFLGGSGSITVNGPFTIAGTSLTSTSNTLQVAAGYNFLFFSGTFHTIMAPYN